MTCLSARVMGGTGSRRQRRAPAPDQDQQQIVGPGGLGEGADLVGRGLAARVGDRVPGLYQAGRGSCRRR